MKTVFKGLLLCAFIVLGQYHLLLADGIVKSKLKVLYVGGSSDFADTHYASAAQRELDVQQRMKTFETLLKQPPVRRMDI
ncbi:hypothetical protein HQ865_13145 [Mucilaginibacter mali]|uniref:Uncharacterized protein n=1 Tax=Mucilaginibacter mali TaxID=2740462 RepID=A0A7D4UDJ8_9SPHI|nr:hypothetical protein [Mucilaginibacter mali]QKJ30659.1 hypothetical protein HQ865_13145 [Mucilaginibacter mali]